jgi:hypothetical protein
VLPPRANQDRAIPVDVTPEEWSPVPDKVGVVAIPPSPRRSTNRSRNTILNGRHIIFCRRQVRRCNYPCTNDRRGYQSKTCHLHPPKQFPANTCHIILTAGSALDTSVPRVFAPARGSETSLSDLEKTAEAFYREIPGRNGSWFPTSMIGQARQ